MSKLISIIAKLPFKYLFILKEPVYIVSQNTQLYVYCFLGFHFILMGSEFCNKKDCKNPVFEI